MKRETQATLSKSAQSSKSAKLPRHRSFGWLIAVLGGQMADALDERLKQANLNLGLWPSLFALWEEEGLTQAELAQRCQTANYTTTRVLDSLEKLELVERKPHPTSRRAYQIFLTKKGRQLETSATDAAMACNEEFLAPLSKQERKQLVALVMKMLSARPGVFLPEDE